MADSTSHRVSIQLQSGHVNHMANVMTSHNQHRVAKKLMREAEAVLEEQYSAAVIGTMRWLIANEADIKAWLKIDKADRALILARPDVAAGAVRAIEAEAAARAVGEVLS